MADRNYQRPQKRRKYRSWMRCENPEPPRSTASRNRAERLYVQNFGVEHEANPPMNVRQEINEPNIQEPAVQAPHEEIALGHGDMEVAATDREPEVSFDSRSCSSCYSSPSDQFGASDHSSSDQSTDTDRNEQSDNDPMDEDEDVNEWGPTRYNDLNEQLFHGLDCTKFECILMILSFSFRHNLSQVATEDLCKLINTIFQSKAIPTSKYMFKKIFGNSSFTFHMYCPDCESHVVSIKSSEKRMGTKNCEVCQKECTISNLNDGHCFVTFSVKEQVRFLLESTENILDLLRYRFLRHTENNVISDIYDGKVYKDLSQDGKFLSTPYNLSCTFSTDGANFHDSTKKSLWPVQFRLNELPPDVRFSQNNAMVAGLWFGAEPNMPLFLSTFVTEMNDLYHTGFEWQSPAGDKIRSKLILLNCVADSKAKPIIQNIKQFNGYYGCGYCLHPGVVIAEGSKQAKYPMGDELSLLDDNGYAYAVTKFERHLNREVTYQVVDRDDESTRKDMETAEQQRGLIPGFEHVRGIKGKSVLIFLAFFNLVMGFCIDYMHNALLGVAKLLAGLWFDTTSKGEPYYIPDDEDKFQTVNKRLLNIKPPTSISRRPRSLSDRLFWKANEWRSWLLFYSLPCLAGILPPRYLQHHCLLVSAIHILLSDNISSDDLTKATWYLGVYCGEFQKLYSKSCMNYNVHLLLHIGKCVEWWGPLFCYSAFSFEAGNGCLTKLVKGSRGILNQIAEKYLRCKAIPKTLQLYDVSENVLEYCRDLMCYRSAKVSHSYETVTVLGVQRNVPLTVEEEQTLLLSGHNVTQCSYEKMIINNVMYHSRCYVRQGKKSDNCLVKLRSGEYGVIQRIIDPTHFRGIAGQQCVLILLREIRTERNESVCSHPSGAKAAHIKVCCPVVFGRLKVVEARDILKKAIMVNIIHRCFITEFPNIYETD